MKIRLRNDYRNISILLVFYNLFFKKYNREKLEREGKGELKR